MRLGKVYIIQAYVVDLDNADMVDHASTALIEDVEQASMDDTLDLWVRTEEDPTATKDQIEDFLLDEG